MKIKIKDSQFENYKSCLINAITADKIQSKLNESKINMLSSLEKIDQVLDLSDYINLHLEPTSMKKLRNAVYQRKFSDNNDLVVIKLERSIFEELQSIAFSMGDANYDQVIKHLIELYDDSKLSDNDIEIDENEAEDSFIENHDEDNYTDESYHDVSISFPFGNSGAMVHTGLVGGLPIYSRLTGAYQKPKPSKDFFKDTYNGDIVPRKEAVSKYKKHLKENRIKKTNPEITQIINETLPDEFNEENIKSSPELLHQIRKILIEKEILSKEIIRENLVISKSFSYADYEEDAYGYQLLDMMVKCYGVEFNSVSKGTKDGALVFTGMPANVQVAYELELRTLSLEK